MQNRISAVKESAWVEEKSESWEMSAHCIIYGIFSREGKIRTETCSVQLFIPIPLVLSRSFGALFNWSCILQSVFRLLTSMCRNARRKHRNIAAAVWNEQCTFCGLVFGLCWEITEAIYPKRILGIRKFLSSGI